MGAPASCSEEPRLRKHLLCRESAQTDAENHCFLSYWGGINIFMNHTIQSSDDHSYIIKQQAI